MKVVWSEDIDAILRVGRSLSEIGSKNWVLTKSDALEAVRRICELEIPILGGDAYRLTGGKLIFDCAGWHSDPREGEPRSFFARRSELEATFYISAYPSDDVLFAIVPDAPLGPRSGNRT